MVYYCSIGSIKSLAVLIVLLYSCTNWPYFSSLSSVSATKAVAEQANDGSDDQLPQVPIIDISTLMQPLTSTPTAASVATAQQLDRVLRERGVFIATGHGLNEHLRSRSFSAALRLFGLPLVEGKQPYSVNHDVRFGRGYLSFGQESGLIGEYFEPKEGYSYGQAAADYMGAIDQDTSTTGAAGSVASTAVEVAGSSGDYESADVMATPAALINGSALSMENLWPSMLRGDDIHTLESDLYRENVRISKSIVEALGLNFDCDGGDEQVQSTRFRSVADLLRGGEHISLMRLFHYYSRFSPEVQQMVMTQTRAASDGALAKESAAPDTLNIIGSSPHTDWGFLTLIMADAVPGLQFLHHNTDTNTSQWVDVPHVEGGLVVNGGDYLSLITRGVYKSPIHRVVAPQGDRDRFSFVFFFYPNYDAPVSGNLFNHCQHHSARRDGGSASDESSSSGSISSSSNSNGGGEVSFNTLLHEAGAVGDAQLFGDWMVKKWQGVFRKQ